MGTTPGSTPGLDAWPPAARNGPQPTTNQVDALIDAASRHPLGRQFLLDGAPDAVAAIFSVHAFVVDAARDRLRSLAHAGVTAGAP